MNNRHIVDRLYEVIQNRAENPSPNSYTAALMEKGIDAILKKVGEEATEVVIAGKGGNRDQIVYESADLIFHLLLLLAHQQIPPEAVFTELSRRFGISGIEEKSGRV